ncbi:hypothetical protein [Acetobacter fabarum]|uniref:hypothetical protein n=1 Tax=Acetobacter fabarum TaxID=483199 RepID=UPI0039E98D42
MTDPRIEAAVDAVIKARCWRDSRWGDGAIGGFDYSTDNKKRHVIRDHEAEAREGKTVILFETDDYEEYEREYRRACIRREISAALAAANEAAPVHAVPMPIPADRMETAKNTLLCWKNGALTDEDAIGMIVCGVSGPQSPETITIPEVRNDRPIPEIGETHS